MKRLSSDGRLIHRRPPFNHGAVHGDSFSGSDEDFISRPEAVRVDAFFDAIAPPDRLSCSKGANSINGSPSAEGTPLLKEASQFKEERYQSGGRKGAGRGSSKNGDGNQLVSGTARVSGHYSAKPRYKRWDSYYGCRQTSTKFADLPLVRRETH
jgi:hypothetical protein